MAKNIPLSELADEVEKALAEYSQDVADGIKTEVKQVAKEAVQTLKATSPKKTGEYAGGWKVKTEYEADDDIRVRVYNSKKPQLTHLLENGHAKQNGGRVEGHLHIATVERQISEKLEERVKVVAKG